MEPSISFRQMLAEAALSAAFFATLFRRAQTVFTSKRFLTKWRISRGTGEDISCKTISGIFGAGASIFGFYLMANPADINNKTENTRVEHILLVTIGYFLYDIGAMYSVHSAKLKDQIAEDRRQTSVPNFFQRVSNFVTSQPLIIAHHLGIGLFFAPVMFTRLDHEPGDLMIACALIFESSTPFVSARAVLSHLDLKSSALYLANGVAMVVVFFACRILVYPLFYATYGSQRGLSFIEAVRATPFHCQIFMLTVFLPQFYWFKIMLNGAIKIVRELNNNEEGEKVKGLQDGQIKSNNGHINQTEKKNKEL